ncbi:MAG: hypothetical protein KDE64_13280, partial [Rhodocyclaceae bacterium]|nr:hypothetical protein [Rhodocyclaceae bacterium]
MLPIIPAPPVTTIMWVSRLRFRSKRFRAQGEALCILAKRPGRPYKDPDIVHATPVCDRPMSPDRNSIADAVDRFASITVLVVGDVMLDRFIHGALDRISPEAPIPVLQARGEETMLGGAGNVVANIASLGGNARLCAVIGDDAPGNAVLGLLSAGAVEASGVLRSATRRTSCKSRYIAQNQQVLRFDEEDTTPLAK